MNHVRLSKASAALVVLAVVLAVARPAAAEELVVDADAQFAFATTYFDKGQYFRAISEYERCLYFFPDHEKAPEALYMIARAYQEGERPGSCVEALSKLTRVFPASGWAARGRILGIRCLAGSGRIDEALGLCDDVAEATDDPDLAARARAAQARIYVEQGRFQDAARALKAAEDLGLACVSNVADALGQAEDSPSKSPTLAGILAVVPGAGHLYTGRKKDAAISFAINAAAVAVCIEAFSEDQQILGTVVALVGAGFYVGNIVSAANSARKANEDEKRRRIDNILEAGGDCFAARPAKGPAPARVAVKFSF